MARVSIETADGRKVCVEDEHSSVKKLKALAVEALAETAPEPREPSGFKAPAPLRAYSWAPAWEGVRLSTGYAPGSPFKTGFQPPARLGRGA
jgi:hypothetical protein